jgi:phosphoribosylglycinamide formyltransferase-1
MGMLMTLAKPVRLGIIGSSGGGALIAADACLRAVGVEVEWVVVTDRACGLAQWSSDTGHQTHRLKYDTAVTFSERALALFKSAGCQDVLMFYTRRVASPLISDLRIWNIHPSLLPAFAGLRGVEDAWRAKVTIFGATLHRVDEGLDTGPIWAQVAAPLKQDQGLQRLQRLSYLQKTWLTLTWFCIVMGLEINDEALPCAPGVALAWPGLPKPFQTVYCNWVAREEKPAV